MTKLQSNTKTRSWLKQRMISSTSWWTSAWQATTKKTKSSKLLSIPSSRRPRPTTSLRWSEPRVHFPTRGEKKASPAWERSMQCWTTPWSIQTTWPELRSTSCLQHKREPWTKTHHKKALETLSLGQLALSSRLTSWTLKKSLLQANSVTNGRTSTETSRKWILKTLV